MYVENLRVPKEIPLTKEIPLRELFSSSLSWNTFFSKFHAILANNLLSYITGSDSFEILTNDTRNCNVQVKYRVRAGKFHGCTRREPTWAHLWPTGPVIVASSIISRILIQAPQLGAACSRMLPRWKKYIARNSLAGRRETGTTMHEREKEMNAGMGKKKRWWRDEVQGHSTRNERREKEGRAMHNAKRKKERAEKVYARAHRDRRDKKMGRRWRRKKESPKGRSSQRSLCGCLWLAAFTIQAPSCVPPSFLLLLRAFLARRSPHGIGASSTFPPFFTRRRLSRLSFGESFRLCDNWLPHRSRVAGRSPRPPSVQWETFLIIFHSARLSYKPRLRLLSAATIVRFIISARKSLMNLISYFTSGK